MHQSITNNWHNYEYVILSSYLAAQGDNICVKIDLNKLLMYFLIKCYTIYCALGEKLPVACCTRNSNKVKTSDYYGDLDAKIVLSLIAIISVNYSLAVRATDNNIC